MLAPGELIHLLQNSVRDSVGRELLLLQDDRRDAFMSKKLQRGILRVTNAVGMKYDDITRIENHAALVVSRILNHAKRKPFETDFFAAPSMQEERLLLPSVSDA